MVEEPTKLQMNFLCVPSFSRFEDNGGVAHTTTAASVASVA